MPFKKNLIYKHLVSRSCRIDIKCTYSTDLSSRLVAPSCICKKILSKRLGISQFSVEEFLIPEQYWINPLSKKIGIMKFYDIWTSSRQFNKINVSRVFMHSWMCQLTLFCYKTKTEIALSQITGDRVWRNWYTSSPLQKNNVESIFYYLWYVVKVLSCLKWLYSLNDLNKISVCISNILIFLICWL